MHDTLREILSLDKKNRALISGIDLTTSFSILENLVCMPRRITVLCTYPAIYMDIFAADSQVPPSTSRIYLH